MTSSFIDSIKLVLSDTYLLSDSEYKKLSDIFIEAGLSESIFDSGLLELMFLSYKNQMYLPMSLDSLKDLWESQSVPVGFIKMLTQMVQTGAIKLIKMKKDKFYSDDRIRKSVHDPDSDKIVVVRGTELYNNVFSKFTEIVDKSNSLDSVTEGVSNMPKSLVGFISKTNSYLKKMRVIVSCESYNVDEALGIHTLGLILSGTSDYTCKESDIQRIAKKYISKNNNVKSVEAHRDSKSELYLEIVLSKISNTFDLPLSVYSFIEDLELNY